MSRLQDAEAALRTSRETSGKLLEEGKALGQQVGQRVKSGWGREQLAGGEGIYRSMEGWPTLGERRFSLQHLPKAIVANTISCWGSSESVIPIP